MDAPGAAEALGSPRQDSPIRKPSVGRSSSSEISPRRDRSDRPTQSQPEEDEEQHSDNGAEMTSEDDEGEEDDDDDDDDEEPLLKYAYLTKHLGAVYRNGDATSSFIAAADKMVWSCSPSRHCQG